MYPHLLQKQFKHSVYDEYRDTLLKKGFKQQGQGSSRTVYSRGKIVIKTPHNEGGFYDNIMEAYAYRVWRSGADDRGRVYAPCRLLPNGCLMMPFIKKMERIDMPDWTHCIDGAQCGKYKDRIVIYDAGYDLYYTTGIKEKSRAWARVDD